MQRQPATPEEVWAILREVSASQRETDRRMQETDRQMQETDRHMKETDRQLRELKDLFNGQWGKLMEALVEGDLVELLSQRGIEVDHTVCNLKSRNGAPRWEIDIIAANGDEVVAVEVKTTLKVKQVADFIETLKVFPEEAPSVYRGTRTYGAPYRRIGRIGGVCRPDGQRLYEARTNEHSRSCSASETDLPAWATRRPGRPRSCSPLPASVSARIIGVGILRDPGCRRGHAGDWRLPRPRELARWTKRQPRGDNDRACGGAVTGTCSALRPAPHGESRAGVAPMVRQSIASCISWIPALAAVVAAAVAVVTTLASRPFERGRKENKLTS